MPRKRPLMIIRYEAEVLIGLMGAYSYRDLEKTYRNAAKVDILMLLAIPLIMSKSTRSKTFTNNISFMKSPDPH